MWPGLDFDPGSETAYSNFGYAVLGTLIEGVTGLPYQRYVREQVFEPAGVEDVSLARDPPAKSAAAGGPIRLDQVVSERR